MRLLIVWLSSCGRKVFLPGDARADPVGALLCDVEVFVLVLSPVCRFCSLESVDCNLVVFQCARFERQLLFLPLVLDVEWVSVGSLPEVLGLLHASA